MNPIALILTIAVIVFFGHSWRNEMWRYRWYRRRRGGSWYKYELTGHLPGLVGTFWTQIRHETHRYYVLVAEEHYDNSPLDEDYMQAMAYMNTHSYKEGE